MKTQKTQNEIERVREVEQALNQVIGMFDTETLGLAPEFGSVVVGIMMGVGDALFTIRDGDSWRGMTDPQDIARQVLRDLNVGE